MKTAVYMRVSTKKQEVEAQQHRIEQYLEGQALEVVVWYIDRAQSGTTLERPQFKALQEAIFDGSVNQVVMYSLDRFARTMVEGLVELDKWMKAGVRLVFVVDHLVLEGASPITDVIVQCLLAMKLAFAEAENERRGRRQRDGIQAARKKQIWAHQLADAGKSDVEIAAEIHAKPAAVRKMLGAPPGKLYWGVDKPWQIGKRKKSPREAYRLKNDRGMSFRQVAKVMGLSLTTVQRYIHEESARRLKQQREGGSEAE